MISFLGPQLDRAGCKIKQPETRKLFESINDAPHFSGGINAHRGTWGLHLVCLLLQLLASLDKTSCALIGSNWKVGKWLINGPINYSAILQLDLFCKREICGIWAFNVLSTNISETKARFCLRLVCMHMSTCVMNMRYVLKPQMVLLTLICKGTLFNWFKGKCL